MGKLTTSKRCPGWPWQLRPYDLPQLKRRPLPRRGRNRRPRLHKPLGAKLARFDLDIDLGL